MNVIIDLYMQLASVQLHSQDQQHACVVYSYNNNQLLNIHSAVTIRQFNTLPLASSYYELALLS